MAFKSAALDRYFRALITVLYLYPVYDVFPGFVVMDFLVSLSGFRFLSTGDAELDFYMGIESSRAIFFPVRALI